MRNSLRAGVLVATGALVLVFAGSAFSAITPRLMIGTTTQKGNSLTTVEARVATTDDALGRLQIYVPTSYKVDSPPGGVEVGTADATALSTQIGPGTELPIKMVGTLTTIPVADPAVDFENASCDRGPHLGAWMARVVGGGNAWSFPVFIDQTTGAETQFGPAKLVICLRPPSLDQYGNKLVTFSLGLNRITAPAAAGIYRWRSLWTPYATGASTLNESGTVEAQSIAHLPKGVLTIAGKRTGKAHVRLTISGKVIVDGEALNGAVVAIRHGTTRSKLVALGNAKTNASGSYLKVVRLEKAQYFQAGTTVGGDDLGAAGCTASFGSAVPCVSATNAKVALVSRLIHFSR